MINLRDHIVLPVLVSLAIHALVVFAVTWGWQAGAKPKKVYKPQHIQAKLVSLEQKAKTKATAQKKPKKIDLTARRKEQERIKKIAEQKRQAQLKKKSDLDAKKEAEKKKQEKEASDRKKKQKLKEKERQQQLQLELEEDMLEEKGLLQEDIYANEAQSYVALIQQRVEQYWSRPPSARNGMRCELTLVLVPNGRVIDVSIKKGSGNAAFDRSAIAAVKKAEQFSELKNMSIEVFERHFRQFSMAFQPTDLRQ